MAGNYLKRAQKWVDENPGLTRSELDGARGRVVRQLKGGAEPPDIRKELTATAEYLKGVIESREAGKEEAHVDSESLAAGVSPGNRIPTSDSEPGGAAAGVGADLSQLLDCSPLVDHGLSCEPEVLAGADKQRALDALISSGLISRGVK